jgi:hypothetical protein
MEFKKLVFPAPPRQWEWDDFYGEIFWVPVPKNGMTQLTGIFSGLTDLSARDLSIAKSSNESSRFIKNNSRNR